MQSTNASELATDEGSAQALNKFNYLNKRLESMEKRMATVQKL